MTSLLVTPIVDELIAGVDEVGRGPLAGPVLAAAVILHQPVQGLADSKALSPRRREMLLEVLRQSAWIGIGAASVREIDRINILQASLLAMRRAVDRLPVRPDHVLVDGNVRPPIAGRVTTLVGGDRLVAEISAASIVAKVVRDRLMQRLAKRYPAYAWHSNAGYGTRAHLDALKIHGATIHHRRSFAPVRAVLGESRA